jgi:F-type H+-transporting ATPase subunit a
VIALLAMTEAHAIVTAGILVIILCNIAVLGTARLERIPRGLQNFLELLTESMRGLTVSVIGPHGVKYTPYIGTIFIFTLIMNLMSLLPPALHLEPPTVRFDTTFALGIVTYLFVIFVAIKENGLWKFIKHLANWIPTEKWYHSLIQLVLLSPLMFFLHSISECVRPITLGFRLFMNMSGKEALVLGMLDQGAFGFVIYAAVLVPLALIVSVVQATIFTMLTCVYLSIWTTHDEEHHEEAPHTAHH